MKRYIKPIILVNEDVSEGVYAASGSNCFTSTATIVQAPSLGMDSYCVQLNASHDASHHSNVQRFSISFDQPVTYISSNASRVFGSGTTSLVLEYEYHTNNVENVGLGNVYVKAGNSLAILSTSCEYCNENCNQH